MSDLLYPWLGDVYNLEIPREIVGLIVVLSSVTCGALIGLERERRDKPAGMRTVILISVGSTIFTMASIMLAETKAVADPARVAAQIVTGIGFLGAGAIIQLRGSVLGLTTGATIWTVAAIGVVVGSGYVMAGIGFTIIVFATLSLFRRLENLVGGPCVPGKVVVEYNENNGKARPRLQMVFDQHLIPDDQLIEEVGAMEEPCRLTLTYCKHHRNHRVILKEIADIPDVVRLETT